MPTLLLMRHGKSDWEADYAADHDRPLAPRGVRSAKIMGRLLTGLDLAPGHVISSTAERARATTELAARAGEWDVPVVLDPGLYGGSPREVLQLVAAIAPEVDRLMLVGHEPTLSMLVGRLTGAREAMKTATVAVIEIAGVGWSSLVETQGELIDVHHPRSYFGSEWDID